MAIIEMRPDTIETGVWWLYWVGREEIVARIDRDLHGIYTVTPRGPHWSPMKSIGRVFGSPDSALHEVQMYFERR
jgi:hypothetical protein